jgi:hypothetical protein
MGGEPTTISPNPGPSSWPGHMRCEPLRLPNFRLAHPLGRLCELPVEADGSSAEAQADALGGRADGTEGTPWVTMCATRGHAEQSAVWNDDALRIRLSGTRHAWEEAVPDARRGPRNGRAEGQPECAEDWTARSSGCRAGSGGERPVAAITPALRCSEVSLCALGR